MRCASRVVFDIFLREHERLRQMCFYLIHKPSCDVLQIFRDGRYDLTDFFFKEALKAGVIGHGQQDQGGDTRHPPLQDDLVGGSSTKVAEQSADAPESRVLDLHGHSLPLAHAAVRYVFAGGL